MKEVLKKLFTPEPVGSMTATVSRRITTGWYECVDDSGRILQAETTVKLSPGQRVAIQSGRIVSLSGAGQNIKTYEV